MYNLLIHNVFHYNHCYGTKDERDAIYVILSVPFLALHLASLVLQVQTRNNLSTNILEDNSNEEESPSEFSLK